MQPTRSCMIDLIKNEVHDSARKVRYYDYLARHLMRINNTLQFIGVISSFLTLFSLIGGLETPTLVLLGSASATLTLCTLRNYAYRSRRSSEISLQLAQLHFDWHDLWNEALANEECDSFTRFKQLYARQLSILHFVPLDLTLSPWLARRSQHVLHDYWTPALQAAPAPRGSDQAQSL